ncbi:hypothetical protein [Clostridium oryzae]|uniref:Cell wall-active antibiotics response LiaF-like C-terminal domain-containing protein n=1 Tax=Clostridium oryzae TaxID=1450648 RepID=A0A1V4IAN6_9CLOT|nr:hypothetical protein [Clostridium oryzae]OPJ56705.1 hypothetical protein CLORY_41950 [Clostridium oryzae]
MRRGISLWRIIVGLIILKFIINIFGPGMFHMHVYGLQYFIHTWVNRLINLGGVAVLIAIISGRRRRKMEHSDNFNTFGNGSYQDNYGERYTKPEKGNENVNYNSENYNTPMYSSSRRDILFSDRKIVATGNEAAFNVAFSNGRIDLSALPQPESNRSLKINVAFSDSRIKIDENIPMVIKVKSMFSDARLPNNDNISFGQDFYKTRSYVDGKPHFYVEMNTAFSSSKIIDKTR